MSFKGSKVAKDLLKSRFWVNQLDKTYITHLDRMNKGRAMMIPDRLWKEGRLEKMKMANGEFRRLRGYSAPAQERRFTISANIRKRNRAQASFFCRYILTQKNGTRVNLE